MSMGNLLITNLREESLELRELASKMPVGSAMSRSLYALADVMMTYAWAFQEEFREEDIKGEKARIHDEHFGLHDRPMYDQGGHRVYKEDFPVFDEGGQCVDEKYLDNGAPTCAIEEDENGMPRL